MPNSQRVTIIGHLGKDPDYKELDGDKYRASFSVATTERYKKDGEWVNGHTEWHNIIAWNNRAQDASRLKKGDAVMIVGKLRTRNYPDKKHPEVKHYITEIIPSEIYKLDYQKRSGGAPPPADEFDVGDLGMPLDLDNNPLTPGE